VITATHTHVSWSVGRAHGISMHAGRKKEDRQEQVGSWIETTLNFKTA